MQIRLLFRFLIPVSLALTCLAASAADAPSNVAGTWTITVQLTGRTATQTVDLKQDADKLTGTFKGPEQTGTLDGTVVGNAVKFHVTARFPMDYEGTADGDNMKGTLTIKNLKREWTATRAK